MRVFNKDKTVELFEYDVDKGYLVLEKLFIAHHEAIEKVDGKFHYETIKEFPNGGKEVKKVWDIEPAEEKDAWDEYEDIQVYIPYTEKELKEKANLEYEFLVDSMIRERYSLSHELSILRQRDSKPIEFEEYNDYAEQCKQKAKIQLQRES